jgi:Uma2 family endonuclease
MSTVQPITPDPRRRHRLNVNDYYKISEAGVLTEKDRVELIEGELIDMAPIGSLHSYILNKLNRVFTKQLPENTLVRIQDPLRLDQYSEPQPDLVVVNNKNYSSHHPDASECLLAIEVADSSFDYDFRVKIPLYARFKIPEVWIVELNTNKIHIFQNPSNDAYLTHNELTSGTVPLKKIPHFIFDIDDLWKT